MDDCKSSGERCVLCLDQKRSPVRIQCGHSFCFGCLDVYKSYRKYPWATKCPICRDVLKEKKKATKRKHSDLSSDTNNSTLTSMTENHNSSATPSANHALSNQQSNILEEFMALATNYFDEGREDNNPGYYNFETLDGTTSGDVDTEGENETQNDLDFVDSYEDELNSSTDSEEFDDSQYYDDEYNYYYYFDDDEDTHDGSHLDSFYSEHDYYDQEEVESSFVDLVDDGDSNEVHGYDIDWDSDVIIID